MIDVYCHTCKVTGKSYVGQSCHGMEHRWKGHCQSAGKCDLLFAKAIHKHGPEAFTHELLAQCHDQEDADNLEDFFIQELKTLVPRGYNLKGGGANGRPSEETRQKISAARKGQKHSEEHRRNIGVAGKGRKHSEETKAKMSASNKGQKRSEETRRNLSAVAKLRPPRSEEVRRKISDSLKGRKLSEEVRRKMSAARKGRKPSEETKLKMRAAAKLRAAKKREKHGAL